MPSPPPSRRLVLLIVAASFTFAIIFVTSFRSAPISPYQSQRLGALELSGNDGGISLADLQLDDEENTGAIAPKLGNETAKAELGRAAWKYFHTVMARFPDKPTAEESQMLKSYIHLFQRLYPCGECAGHFGQILLQFPPQTSSRSTAAVWACHVHNEVNKSLKKELFDCSKIGDFYDCGCAEDIDEATGMEKEKGKENL